MRPFLVLYGLFLFLGCSLAQSGAEELGKVKWLRNFDEACKLAKQKDLPVLILFQEVPGCATCKNFGHDVLSHPLVVEAIHTYFIPLAIFNNKQGHDAEVLARYREPSWNNPVLRIVDPSGKDVLPRHSGHYRAASVVSYINSALLKTHRLVPRYLNLLETELNAYREEMVLEMYCFWSGEKNIGDKPGVLYTEPGYSNGREVVKVVFDPASTNPTKIVEDARKTGNADAIHITAGAQSAGVNGVRTRPLKNYTVDRDKHYYLKHSDFAALPLTPMQATRINSALGKGDNADIFLSPLQGKMLRDVKSGKLAGKERYNASPWYASWPESYFP